MKYAILTDEKTAKAFCCGYCTKKPKVIQAALAEKGCIGGKQIVPFVGRLGGLIKTLREAREAQRLVEVYAAGVLGGGEKIGRVEIVKI